jgi:cytochrome c-type biogenesis protein CcmH
VILFWVICAAFILIALVFVLPPALQRSAEADRKTEDERRQANIAVYRDQLSELESDLKNGIVSQEQYTQDREEIERRLLEDTKSGTSERKAATTAATARYTAYAIGIAIPLVAVVFYLNVGNPKAIDGPPPTTARSATGAGGERTQEQIEANVAALAKRLQSNPSDAEGWTMLARSYSSMGKFPESVGAYTKATELTPNNADLWAEFAFATAMANGRSLEGRPMELIDHALKVDPENLKALQLAGTAAFQAKDYKKAIGYWERVLKRVPPNSEVTEAIQGRINEAKTLSETKVTR